MLGCFKESKVSSDIFFNHKASISNSFFASLLPMTTENPYQALKDDASTTYPEGKLFVIMHNQTLQQPTPPPIREYHCPTGRTTAFQVLQQTCIDPRGER
jgi:hypothetical protein